MKIQQFKDKIDSVIKKLQQDFSSIRTGRPSPSLIENIKVEAYEGSPALSIKELATIAVPENNLLTIEPWDVSLLTKIEKALRTAPGGFNPVVFDNLIRLPFPPLSTERRQELAKIIKAQVEETKISIRQIRQDEMRSIDEMEENGVIGEDERFKIREEVESIVRQKSDEAEHLGREKEVDLMKV